MKKLLSISTVLLLILALLAGCSQTLPLPEGMDSETVKDKALEVMAAVNGKNYAAITGMFREDLREGLTDELWEQQLGALWETTGAFEEVTGVQTTGYELDDGTPCAVAVVTCKYENNKHVWNVTFDTDYQLLGVVIAA